MDEVGALIRRLRRAQGLTGKQLATAIGVRHQQVISRWETGVRPPTWEQARALGAFFGRDPADFYKEGPLDVATQLAKTADEAEPFQIADTAGTDMTPWPIPVMDGYNPRGCAYFSKTFLLNHNLNPVRCRVINVRDSSMSPILPLGSSCLVDEQRTEMIDGALYAVEHESVLLIRQAQHTEAGTTLAARAPGEPQLRWANVKIIGQVYWMGWIIGASSQRATREFTVVSDTG